MRVIFPFLYTEDIFMDNDTGFTGIRRIKLNDVTYEVFIISVIVWNFLKLENRVMLPGKPSLITQPGSTKLRSPSAVANVTPCKSPFGCQRGCEEVQVLYPAFCPAHLGRHGTAHS